MTESPDMPLLDVARVSYQYATQLALNDVSFQLHRGEIGALIGRNGAGKSTLLRCLGAWTRPTGGKIRLLGRELAENERWARGQLVLVPDTPSFYDDMTAWEHLQFIAQAHRVADWQREAERMLERFGLAGSRDAIPLNFSRGMRYKLALCMAMLPRPTLLLLDEPFGPLDPVSADELWDVLVDAANEQIGVLLSSHQLPPDASLDRYIVLEQGALIADDTPDDLRAAFELPEEYSLDDLLRAALAASARS